MYRGYVSWLCIVVVDYSQCIICGSETIAFLQSIERSIALIGRRPNLGHPSSASLEN